MADQQVFPHGTATSATPTDQPGATGGVTAAVAADAALVTAAVVAVLVGAPVWVSTVLTVGATAVVTERVVRHRGRGLLDAALVGCGLVVVTVVLLGLVLNLTPDGLTRQSWAVGAGVIGIAALAAGLRRPAPASLVTRARSEWARPHRDDAPYGTVRGATPRRGTSLVVGVVCSVLAIAVVGVSFVVAAASTRDNQVAPLAMAATETDGIITGVTLSSGTQVGPYDLIVLADGASTTAATGMYLDGTPRTVPVTVPTVGRALINLVPTGSATPVRQLIVDNGRLTPSTTPTTTPDTPVAPLQMVSVETGGIVTGVTLSSGTPVGPYDLVVLADGDSTTAAAAFYLGASPRTVPVTVPTAGRALINLVPTGSATPILQLIVDDGQLTPATTPSGETTTSPTGETTTTPGTTTAPAPAEMVAAETGGIVTGVTLSSGTPVGPYDLVVLADGDSTTAAAAFYLGASPRTVPVTVPTAGRALINLVPTGSATPILQLIVENGRLTP